MMLNGKIVLVIGVCGGIGCVIVVWFVKEGVVVYVVDFIFIGLMVEEINDGSMFVLLDVMWEEDVIVVMEMVWIVVGKLDILVNVVGIEIEKMIEDIIFEEWNWSFVVNVIGIFLIFKYVFFFLWVVVNLGLSVSLINFGFYDGFIVDFGFVVYCVMKGVVYVLICVMVCDYGFEGICVNVICFGYIDMLMLQSFFDGDGLGGGGGSIEML